MTSPIGKPPNKENHRSFTTGFTLIELIIVMALLSLIFALAAPSLSNFFKGRSILEEARRFLALTRYAQSQAISLSVPMEIQIDANSKRYGLFTVTGYEVNIESKNDAGAEIEEDITFNYDEDYEFELIANDEIERTLFTYSTIVFLPDGTLDEGSLYAVAIKKENDKPLYIVQKEYRDGYEILTQEDYERQRTFHKLWIDREKR
ncbi:MAG: GspH/FimT family pseudopilin [Candidatus Hinthialibacter sp.]